MRNIPPPARELRSRDTRDSYVVVALDREEIFRTATAERSLRYTPHSFSGMARDELMVSDTATHGLVVFIRYSHKWLHVR